MEDEVNVASDNDSDSTDSNEMQHLEVGVESIRARSDDENPGPSNDIIIFENNENNENAESNAGSESNDVASTSTERDFDWNLPASHSYLGSNLEELRGRTILDVGIYMKLPLLIKQSTVLFPGQTLPMAVFGTNVISMLNKCIEKNRTFGVVCLRQDRLEPIGTTAEIYECSPGSPEEGFRIKAKGRQRFQILRMIQGYSEVTANVKIRPEITLPQPQFYKRYISSFDYQNPTELTAQQQKRRDRLERMEAAATVWPAWVYRQYDPYRLSYKIRQQLHFIESRGNCIPIDPADLSYWVAQNLPLNDNERITLLRYDCAISRLQWELKYLTKDRLLVCSYCQIRIGKQSDIFPMSKEGPQSTFCNAGGFIYDTVTLYKAENLKLNEHPPSAEYSWFPGYAWTIATCKGCGTHMGWQFTADKDKSLRPLLFWGLTRRGLKTKKFPKRLDQSSSSLNEYNESDSEDSD